MENINDWLQELYELNQNTDDIQSTKKSTGRTLNLADVLSAIDYRKKDYYEKLTVDQKKEFIPYVIMRYISSSNANSEHYILMVNDIVNANFNALSKHPGLQWKLLTLCGLNKKQYRPWIAPPKGLKKNKLEQEIIKLKPLIKDSDLDLLLTINTKEDFKHFFKDNGYGDKEIAELLKDR